MALIQLRECQIQMLDGLTGTAKIADGGSLTGAYIYRYTFVSAAGETNGGTETATVNPASQQIDLTIATGPAGTTARKIYRTAAGGATGTEKLVTTINDNVTTNYIDNLADGSLGATVPSSNTTTVASPGALTAAVGSAGALTGVYYYKVTFVTAVGETSAGTESTSVTLSAQEANLSSIPTGTAGVVLARKIYRTAAGGGTGNEKYAFIISDNTTTSFVDNLPDADLGASAPASNSTTIAPPAAPTVALDGTSPVAADTDCEVTNVSLNTKVSNQIPVGARFQLSTSGNNTQVFTVQSRTPSSGQTLGITFTPAFGSPAPVNNDTLNFLPQVLTIKIGEGDIKFTEKKQYQYVLDRGNLDTVREQDQQPMEVNIDFQYQFITTGTGELVSPVDALKNEGAASEWVTASSDPCEPYCVDIRLIHTPPCAYNGTEIETVLFPDFRRDSVAYDPKAATITIAGKCNAMEPTVTRSTTAPV